MKEPAFPTPDIGGHAGSDGMSLRDYLAAAALQGLCAAGDVERWPAVAADAYNAADAMLEARKQ